MKEKVRIGIIGTGFARRVQIPAFLMCEGAEIVSVASAQRENAESCAREFSIPHFTENWRETIAREDVDLVCITSPPIFHREQTLFALEQNKHILCEKPMAMNATEARKMCDAARGKNLLTLIDHELRFQSGRQKAKTILRDGAIGKIRHARYIFRAPHRGDAKLAWNWWSDKTQGGGALGAIGSHIIDSLRWFLGAEISEVFCQLQTHVKNRQTENGETRAVTTDDEAHLILRFRESELTEDSTGNISISMVEFPDYQNWIVFGGTLGAMRIGSKGETFLATGAESWRKIDVEIGKSIEGILDSGFPSAFVSFAPKLINAIREGKTKLETAATFEDGLRVQEIIDAAHESNETKRSVMF